MRCARPWVLLSHLPPLSAGPRGRFPVKERAFRTRCSRRLSFPKLPRRGLNARSPSARLLCPVRRCPAGTLLIQADSPRFRSPSPPASRKWQRSSPAGRRPPRRVLLPLMARPFVSDLGAGSPQKWVSDAASSYGTGEDARRLTAGDVVSCRRRSAGACRRGYQRRFCDGPGRCGGGEEGALQ